jgi:hypothetical protein
MMSEESSSSEIQNLKGLHHEGKAFVLPAECRSCDDRKARDPLFDIVHSGRLYFMYCGHIQCRACITEQHAHEARPEDPLACAVCRTHLLSLNTHVDISEVALSTDFLN